MKSFNYSIRTVLIARSAFGDFYEEAWNRALNETGIRSRIFDTHVYLPGTFGRVQQRILWGPGIWKANRGLIESVKSERPDVTLFYQGHHFGPKILQRITPITFVTGAHNDDPFSQRKVAFRYRLLKQALPFYHGYHVYRECNIPEFTRAGIQNCKVLMSYYLPWVDYPRRLDKSEVLKWGCDLVFAGHVEEDQRLECLMRAVRSGAKVRIYGGKRLWKQALAADVCDKVGPMPHVRGENYRKALCGAKIAACFFSKWNRDEYTRRAFEIPACGVFLLAERTSVMQSLYEEGKEAEYFDCPDEFLDKLHFYLSNESARLQIAKAGYRRATNSGYDIYARMRQWTIDVEDWRIQMMS